MLLRFNANAFRNNYNISDLTKMDLAYYAIKVGTCDISRLDMSKEFDFSKKKPTSYDVIGEDIETQTNDLDVYDVILAGVEL